MYFKLNLLGGLTCTFKIGKPEYLDSEKSN